MSGVEPESEALPLESAPGAPEPAAEACTSVDDVDRIDVVAVSPVQSGDVDSDSQMDVATAFSDAAAETSRVSACEAALLLMAVKGFGEQLGKKLDSLLLSFEREQRAEATRERVIDRLHGELQEYKQDLLLKVQRPIFIDLIQLHDDIGKMIEARPLGEGDAALDQAIAMRGILESIQTGIEDILYRQGVEPFTHEANEFDPRKQRAVSTRTTDDPALNKTIAARLRKGFHASDKIVRPEIVTVYAFRQPPSG
jgi:molecular chaperone GrpE